MFVPMKIATFNINNINRRLPNLLMWLKRAKPDIVALQELKSTDNDFPRVAIEKAGYGAVWRGQKTWNGVAILARNADPILIRNALPGDVSDTDARYIEAAVRGIIDKPLPAERKSAARAEIRLQARLAPKAADALRQIHQAGRPGGIGRRLQRRSYRA
jgi:exonuclease III